MMLYKNTKVKVRYPDGDTDYFDNVAGLLQGDTLAQYLFINCLDDMLRTSTRFNERKRLQAEKQRILTQQTITPQQNNSSDAKLPRNEVAAFCRIPPATEHETMLQSLERTAADIGVHVDVDKTEYMCFNQRGDIFTLNSSSLKLVDQVHLPRKQCLIYRDGHQHATSKGMDTYW